MTAMPEGDSAIRRFLLLDPSTATVHLVIIGAYFLAYRVAALFLLSPEQGEAFMGLVGNVFFSGRWIYTDVAYHHPPVAAIVMGFFSRIGWNDYAVRTVAIGVGALTLLLTYQTARKLAGVSAALACLYLLVINDPFEMFHGLADNRGPATLLAVLCCWIVVCRPNTIKHNIVAVVVAFLAGFSRSTIFPLFMLVFAYCLCRLPGFRPRLIVGVVSAAVVVFLATAFVHDWTAFYQQTFLLTSEINYTRLETPEDYEALRHAGGVYLDGGFFLLLAKQIYNTLRLIVTEGYLIQGLPWKELLLLAVVLVWRYRGAARRAAVATSALERWFVVGSLLWFGSMWFAGEDYWRNAQPMLTISLVLVVSATLAEAGDGARLLKWTLLAMVLLSVLDFAYPTRLLADYEGTRATLTRPDGTVRTTAQLPYMREAAQVIAANSKPGDFVMTSDTNLALFAKREPVPGFGDQDWSFRPFWGDSLARRFGYINITLMQRYLEQGLPEIVVICDDADNPFKLAHVYNYVTEPEIRQYGRTLLPLLERNYEAIASFPQLTHRRLDMTIYKRKSGG
jgi:hypothetical protein